MLGVIGPTVFLVVSLVMAVVRQDVMRANGWAGWPSDMALGNAGIPQIVAFLFTGACYIPFALWAVRPALPGRAPWIGFLALAVGDVLLAFRTDAAELPLSWHGTVHVGGVLLVTTATAAVAISVTLSTRGQSAWRVWRTVGAPTALLSAGLLFYPGFEHGWAKIVFVVGITMPIPLVGLTLRRSGSVEGQSSLPA